MNTPSTRLILCLPVFCFAMWGGGIIAVKFAYGSFTGSQIVFARVGFAAVFSHLPWRRWRTPAYRRGANGRRA